MKGVPLLRFLWEPIIELYGSVASTFFQGHSEATMAKFDIAGHETSALVIDEQIMCNGNQFLNIVFEIVLAFQRLVDSEMVSYIAKQWYSSYIFSLRANTFSSNWNRVICVQQSGNLLSEQSILASPPGLFVGELGLRPLPRRYVWRRLQFSLN